MEELEVANGTHNQQHLPGGSSLRIRAWHCGLAVLLGSVSPDIDHALSLLSGRQELWAVLHQSAITLLFIVVALASVIGLRTALDIRSNKTEEVRRDVR